MTKYTFLQRGLLNIGMLRDQVGEGTVMVPTMLLFFPVLVRGKPVGMGLSQLRLGKAFNLLQSSLQNQGPVRTSVHPAPLKCKCGYRPRARSLFMAREEMWPPPKMLAVIPELCGGGITGKSLPPWFSLPPSSLHSYAIPGAPSGGQSL